MIDIDKYTILKKHISTLKKTSEDIHDGRPVYMTDSQAEVIDFDAVKDEYIKELHIRGDAPKSNDALMIRSDTEAVFIEFKNGNMTKKLQFDIRKKMYDSMLMLTDIIGKNISYTRDHLDYILVYNAKNDDKEDIDPKSEYRESRSRDKIDEIILEYGGQRHIKFKLEMFQRYCFRNVYTYTKEEFEARFADKL